METTTRLAIIELPFVFVFRIFTAVAAVPVAIFGVVFIIADVIPLIVRDSTGRFLVIRIPTRALKARCVLSFVATVATTVAAIPATAATVVVVIAVIITLVLV